MDIVTASRDFCDLVERAEGMDRGAFEPAAVRRLAALIAAATELPHTDLAEDQDDDDIPDVSHQAWSERVRAIQGALADGDMYWSTQPVFLAPDGQERPELTVGSLSDDLADTWRELSSVLRWLDGGGDPAVAQWEWRFGFDTHWGAHAIDALRVLRASTSTTQHGDRSEQPEADRERSDEVG